LSEVKCVVRGRSEQADQRESWLRRPEYLTVGRPQLAAFCPSQRYVQTIVRILQPKFVGQREGFFVDPWGLTDRDRRGEEAHGIYRLSAGDFLTTNSPMESVRYLRSEDRRRE
jgi:hypothetical protein